MRILYILAALAALPMLMGASCNTNTADTPPSPPEFTVGDFVMVTDFASTAAALTRSALIQAEDFDGCMVASGFVDGLDAVHHYAPEIESEVDDPDGKIAFPAWDFDGTPCAGIMPTAWPPVEPNPEIAAIAEPMIESTLGLVSMLIERDAPSEGEDCLRAMVVAALLKSGATQIPAALEDVWLEADLKMEISGFEIDYSGCGVLPPAVDTMNPVPVNP